MIKNKKKKVLVLASTFPRWKNDTTPPFVFELEKRLANEFDIHVLAPHFPGAKKYEELDGLKIHRFQYFWPEKSQKLCYEGGILPNIKRNKFLLFQGITLVVSEMISAMKLIRDEKIDLVHAHWIIPQGIVARLLKLFLGKHYILTTWGGDMFAFKSNNKLLLWLYQKIVSNAQYTTSVNKIFVQELESLGNNKVLYIPNGVNTKTFYSNAQERNNNLLFVGRLAEKKGISYLIEALTKLDKNKYNKLIIAGEGPLRKPLEDQVTKLNLQDKIEFIGSVPNSKLPEFYNASSMLIVPSITTPQGDREGLPTVYLEAMASGCPLITTNIDGIEEIIQQRKNGIIVEQKNSNQLAKAIDELLSSKNLSNELKANGIKAVKEKYSWDVVGNHYSRLMINS